MNNDYSKILNAENVFIWRIVHRNNVPWCLEHGLQAASSLKKSPNWVAIGDSELVDKRSHSSVPTPTNGNLNDYVPFYFTPFSPMMYNIWSGRGVPQCSNEEIVIFVSNLLHLETSEIEFVFTDSHACSSSPAPNFYTQLADLNKIDWPMIQKRNFKRDNDDPEKFQRYQAEAFDLSALPNISASVPGML